MTDRVPLYRGVNQLPTEMTAGDTLDKALVGLGNVDNTSDANKPVSTAQATAIAGRLSNAGDTATGSYTFDSSTFFIDATNHRVGVGTTTPQRTAHVVGPDGPVASFPLSVVGSRNILVLENNNNCNISIVGNPTGNSGFFFIKSGAVAFSGSVQYSLSTDVMSLLTSGSPRFLIDASGQCTANVDNTQNLGNASLRWKEVFAGTGTINTSDAREKTSVIPLTVNELAAAKDLASAIGTYQWLQSVQLKGVDARHHVGLTVQQAIAIMQTHGLDPMRYGFICYDQWNELPEIVSSWPAQDAVLDDDGNVITSAVEAGSEVTQAYRAAGDRYSFRHDELLLFIARGFAARLDALEAA